MEGPFPADLPRGIRRIYFSDRLYSEEELPPEFKLFLPAPRHTFGPKLLHREVETILVV